MLLITLCALPCFMFIFFYSLISVISVAQMVVEHGASNAKIMGSIARADEM